MKKAIGQSQRPLGENSPISRLREGYSIWEREYQALLERKLSSGEIRVLPPGDERRGHPRFNVDSATLVFQVQTRFSVLNVSASGLSFLSPFPLAQGQVVKMVLEKTFTVEMEVVNCTAMTPVPSNDTGSYRMHARFFNEIHGKQLLVLLDEMGHLNLEITADN